ncbi:hypothetical protein DXG01_015310 [Tephrocybe rancida]|nr:hypothetical protein DXG01_015310 [Tephrocybe rancida]
MTAYTVVKNDLKGNIEVRSFTMICTIDRLTSTFCQKIRSRYDAAPSQSATLEALVENEKTEATRTATQGLLWLVRSLSFACKALQNSQANQREELTVSCNKAYKESLDQFHNFVIKATFAVAMKACPERGDFYNKLAADPNGAPQSQEALKAQLTKWLEGLNSVVTQLEGFYEQGNHATGF